MTKTEQIQLNQKIDHRIADSVADNRDETLSHLQLAFEDLRQSVASMPLSHLQQCLLLYIDEGMSWKSVRDLGYMHDILLIVDTMIEQSLVSEEVIYGIQGVKKALLLVLDCIDRSETV